VRNGSELAAVREPSGSGGGGSEGVFMVVATRIGAQIWRGSDENRCLDLEWRR
jgi:hypothetical protein